SAVLLITSRRRHTMSKRDWSSDVCSSDLEVTVCDARQVFATTTRFPDADEVVVDWPHRYLRAEADAGRIGPRTAIMVLTHDPKFDVTLLEVALPIVVWSTGAMVSRRTSGVLT